MPTLEELRHFIVNMTVEQREELGWPQDIPYLESDEFMVELNEAINQAVEIGAVEITDFRIAEEEE